jgi:GTP-binding protein Era
MIECPPQEAKKAGYVALLGRPNVGKSTLLNRLLARKLSITSPKPQTTRHSIVGIRTLPGVQIVYVDTPGLHLDARRAINRYMNRVAGGVLAYANVVMFVVEALRWTDEDADVLSRLEDFVGPVILVVNKVDRVADKPRLLPFLREQASKRAFAEVIPVSARRADNLAVLESLLSALLPESEFFFPEDQVTTASHRFIAAELIREKLTCRLCEELPYALAVDIENFIERENLVRVSAVIWVERQGQKRIVIGEKGAVLREVGRQAREEMETLFAKKVFLETWVKVHADWPDDERALCSFGYRCE